VPAPRTAICGAGVHRQLSGQMRGSPGERDAAIRVLTIGPSRLVNVVLPVASTRQSLAQIGW
jgi:hypothetical protein